MSDLVKLAVPQTPIAHPTYDERADAPYTHSFAESPEQFIREVTDRAMNHFWYVVSVGFRFETDQGDLSPKTEERLMETAFSAVSEWAENNAWKLPTAEAVFASLKVRLQGDMLRRVDLDHHTQAIAVDLTQNYSLWYVVDDEGYWAYELRSNDAATQLDSGQVEMDEPFFTADDIATYIIEHANLGG